MTVTENGFNPGGYRDGLSRAVIVVALDKALNMLGQTSKKALLFHLKERYGISFDDNAFSVEQLFSALRDILGNGGASIIMEKVFLERDRIS